MSDSSNVEVVNVDQQPTGGLDADLIAVSVGQAAVTATGSPISAPGTACPAFLVLWELHVKVGS